VANVGHNLPTLAATIAGNLFDLGEATGVRLEHVRIPPEFRARFERPRHGVAGTRELAGVAAGPLLGTIVKPNVGLTAAETGAGGRAVRRRYRFHQGRRCCGMSMPTPSASAR
jgi:ribulose-bisphosphate carboxylase large chain